MNLYGAPRKQIPNITKTEIAISQFITYRLEAQWQRGSNNQEVPKDSTTALKGTMATRYGTQRYTNPEESDT